MRNAVIVLGLGNVRGHTDHHNLLNVALIDTTVCPAFPTGPMELHSPVELIKACPRRSARVVDAIERRVDFKGGLCRGPACGSLARTVYGDGCTYGRYPRGPFTILVPLEVLRAPVNLCRCILSRYAGALRTWTD